MNKVFVAVLTVAMFLVSVPQAQTTKAPATAKGKDAATAESSKPSLSKQTKADTLIVKARLVEIPGPFPPNDLYNYVYIMKYRVLGVVKGTTDKEEILVGHYNPLIARKLVKDKMDNLVDGDVERFEVGAKHVLTLIKPIDKVWKDAKEDEFFDVDDSEKFYCVKADLLK